MGSVTHYATANEVRNRLAKCLTASLKTRESFLTHYSTYARNFAEQSETEQIRELLNIDLQCHKEDKPLAHNIICSFVNHVYNIANTSFSE